jgi:plastocyanin
VISRLYRTVGVLVALGALGALGGYAVGAAPATTGPDPHVALNVSLHDGSIVIAKHAVHDVTYVDFLVHNAGKLTHNFTIGGVGTPPLKAGQTRHLLVAFPSYGKYRYRCTIHGTPKMTGVFQVDRPVPPG